MEWSNGLLGRATSEEGALGRRVQRRGGEGARPSIPSLLPHPGPSTVRRRALGMGFLSALSHSWFGMIFFKYVASILPPIIRVL